MWVAIALVTLAVVTVVALCLPLDIVLRVDADGRPRFGMRLRWLFGLVSKELRRARRKTEQEEAAEPKRTLGYKTQEARKLVAILRINGLPGQSWRLLAAIVRRFRFRELGGNVRVGLDNPADTGLLLGLIAPASFLLRSFSTHEVTVQPAFADEAVLEGYLYGTARLRPIGLVGPLLGFAFSVPAMKAAKTLVLARWKGKR